MSSGLGQPATESATTDFSTIWTKHLKRSSTTAPKLHGFYTNEGICRASEDKGINISLAVDLVIEHLAIIDRSGSNRRGRDPLKSNCIVDCLVIKRVTDQNGMSSGLGQPAICSE